MRYETARCLADDLDALVVHLRYQATKRRLGKQRGAKVAQIDIARRLTEAVWHMLTRNQPFAPAGAALRLAA
jgi:hypothetical protein